MRVQLLHPASPDSSGFLTTDVALVLTDSMLVRAGVPTLTTSQTRYEFCGVRLPQRTLLGGFRGPGYFVVLTSRAPFRLGALEAAGLFNGEYIRSSLAALEPEVLVPEVAQLALGRTGTGARSEVLRYGGPLQNVGVLDAHH